MGNVEISESSTSNTEDDWNVGDKAEKIKGYLFDSEVRAVLTNKAGETRLVCESVVIPGMLHIFSPSQMRHL